MTRPLPEAIALVEAAVRSGCALAAECNLKPDDRLMLIKFVVEQVVKACGDGDAPAPTAVPVTSSVGYTAEPHERVVETHLGNEWDQEERP